MCIYIFQSLKNVLTPILTRSMMAASVVHILSALLHVEHQENYSLRILSTAAMLYICLIVQVMFHHMEECVPHLVLVCISLRPIFQQLLLISNIQMAAVGNALLATVLCSLDLSVALTIKEVFPVQKVVP